MGRIRARELGFDACMFMLHKTFGAPKGGGGPAVGAYGCTEELARFLPAPLVACDGERYGLDQRPPRQRRQGARVLGQRAADRQGLRVGAGDGRGRDPRGRRPLGARQQLHGEAAARDPAASPCRTRDLDERAARDDPLQPRRADRGDGRHRPRRPEPDGRLRRRRVLARATSRGSSRSRSRRRPARCGRRRTSTTGSTCSPHVCEEARDDPELVKLRPAQPGRSTSWTAPSLDDPDRWATTWRAYRRKRARQSADAMHPSA